MTAEVPHSAGSDRGAYCWRHDGEHREYVCTCDPPVQGDTGKEGCTWGFNPSTGNPVLLTTPDGKPLMTRVNPPVVPASESAE